MSHYSDIMLGIGTVGGLLTTVGAVAGKKILTKLDRVGDAFEQVAGKPAKLDRSGAIAEPARPGLPAQIAVVRQLAENANTGNVEILRRQDVTDGKIEKLNGRVERVERTAGQTLKAVTQ